MFRRTPLALKNLLHYPRRLCVAAGGVAFAVLLIFMELGFLAALLDSTVQVVRIMRGDLFMMNRAKYAMVAIERFPMQRLQQARSQGNLEVIPVYIERSLSVLRPDGRKGFPIRVLAADLATGVFQIPELETLGPRLQSPDTALYDTASKPDYAFPSPDEPPGQYRGELAGRRLQLVGHFRLCTDFATEGNLLMTAANFARFFPARCLGADPLSEVDLAVIRIGSDESVEGVQQRLRQTMPPDVQIMTRAEFEANERGFWLRNTPIGYIFVIGTIIGFIVGIIICYQIIFAGLDDHMAEFATLKAMGYSSGYFIRLVLSQSFYLTLLGYLPGALCSWVLYRLLADATGLLLQFRASVGILVFLGTLLMCVTSGLLALRKLLAADPASLF